MGPMLKLPVIFKIHGIKYYLKVKFGGSVEYCCVSSCRFVGSWNAPLEELEEEWRVDRA